MTAVALLSNPRSTGNRAILPLVRDFCVRHPDIFHYEVEDASQIGDALATIALVEPKVIAINGGDGTVQAALTELYTGEYFNGTPPPIAVLPNGKTNLIALDLGAKDDPIATLERVLAIAKSDLSGHVIERELIELSGGSVERPVLGMFLGGAGLGEAIIFCRHKLYPTGLPNGLCHAIAAVAALLSNLLNVGGRLLPRRPEPMRISMVSQGQLSGRFSVLIVTTLEKMLLHADATRTGAPAGRMKLFAVDHGFLSLARGLIAAALGRLNDGPLKGIHIRDGDSVTIEGSRSSVILDGEMFEGTDGHPIVLHSTRPVPFLSLAA